MCGVATQGDINGNKWVTDFKMSYLSGGRIWTLYKDGNEDVVRTKLLFLYMLRFISREIKKSEKNNHEISYENYKGQC